MKYTKEETKECFAAMVKRLSAILRELALKPDEMEDKLGLSQSDLSEIELGKKDIEVGVFLQLATEFNVNLQYLYLGIGDMFQPVEEKDGGGEVYDFQGSPVSFEKFQWLMKKSAFFRHTIMSHACKILLLEEETVKASLKKEK